MNREILRKRLQGIIVPLVTPFTDEYALNEEALLTTVPHVLDTGVTALIPCGTSGEFAAMTRDERQRVIRTTVEAATGRALVIAGTADPSIRRAIALSQDAQNAGANAVMVLPPSYFKHTDDEVFDYFRLLDQEIDLPFFFYNNPGVTNYNISLDLIDRLAQLEHFGGMKETNSHPVRFFEEHRRFEDDFALIPAGEPTAIFTLLTGALGFITVAANFNPALMVSIYDAVQAGEVERAFTLYDQLYTYRQLFEARVKEGYPTYIPYAKAAMNLLGLPAGPVRPPLRMPDPSEEERIRAVLEDVMGLEPNYVMQPETGQTG